VAVRAQAGDREAFAALVASYQSDVLRTARALLDNHHDAEEVAQEAFVQARRDLGTLRDPRRFPGWLNRIVRTRCSNFRARWRQQALPLDEVAWTGRHTQDSSREHASRVEAQVVHEAIAALSEPNRVATSLFYLDGHSIEEIATMLAVPAGTVKRRLHDSRQRLKSHITGLAGLGGSLRGRAKSRAGSVSGGTVSRIACTSAIRTSWWSFPRAARRRRPAGRRPQRVSLRPVAAPFP
jgi:RNA polymerase sigma factor (sigma-70 family)